MSEGVDLEAAFGRGTSVKQEKAGRQKQRERGVGWESLAVPKRGKKPGR